MYLEWTGMQLELPRRLAKHATSMAVTVPVSGTGTVIVTVTVTVTVPVTRLGALGSGCASCGLLYGCCEARRFEGWLSMLLRQGRQCSFPRWF